MQRMTGVMKLKEVKKAIVKCSCEADEFIQKCSPQNVLSINGFNLKSSNL